jgi:hypothetical protein
VSGQARDTCRRMRCRSRTRRVVAVVGLSALLAVTASSSAGAARTASPKLNMCTLVARVRLERAIGSAFSTTTHSQGDAPVAAGCHFPPKAIGGTDLGVYASTDVHAGVRHSYRGDFFLTVGSFGRAYGTPSPLAGVGSTAFTAFVAGDPAQGALLVQDSANRAVLVVLSGENVRPDSFVTKSVAVAKLVLAKLRR